MPFEITEAEDAAIDNALKTGEISDSDKVTIDGFIARLSSDSDLPTVDTISKEQMDELTKEIISLSSQYGIKIDTADNGDITFILPNGVKKTHNINALSSVKTLTSDNKQKRPAWRGGKHTQKNGKKTKVRGGSVGGVIKVLGKAVLCVAVGSIAVALAVAFLPITLKNVYNYYQHKDDAVVSDNSNTSSSPKPQLGDIYIANKDSDANQSKMYKSYVTGDKIKITGVPDGYTDSRKSVLATNISTSVSGFYDLKDFESQPPTGGSKNRKSRSKTRKQKRRRAKK